MDTTRTLAIVGALADSSRLLLLNALLDRPHYVEELAQRLEIAPSTVSFHLKKLGAAGLVSKTRDQYYTVYSANRDTLNITLMEIVSVSGIKRGIQEERIQHYESRVIKSLFENGRLRRLPVQKKKRRIVLEELASMFEYGRTYGEEEVDRIISEKYDDYCVIRREFIEERLLTRENQIYWVIAEGLEAGRQIDETRRQNREGTVDERTVLKQRYKDNPPPAGIYQITNKANGKIFIGKGINVRGILNGQQAQLKWGSHRNRDLQQDWNHYGGEQFTFEVVDYLPPVNDPHQDLRADLAALEQLWLAKLEPYGEKGYNAISGKK